MTTADKSTTVPTYDPLTPLCILEHVLFQMEPGAERESRQFWKDYRDENGICELRQLCIDLSPGLDAAWAAMAPDHFDAPFDMEFVPEVLEAGREQHGFDVFYLTADEWIAVAASLYVKQTEPNTES